MNTDDQLNGSDNTGSGTFRPERRRPPTGHWNISPVDGAHANIERHRRHSQSIPRSGTIKTLNGVSTPLDGRDCCQCCSDESTKETRECK